MKSYQCSLVSAAVLLAVAVGPAYAVLERAGPVNTAPSVGGFPAWYQDTTGITLEFCDPKNASEVAGGWCLLLPGDVPIVPEVFPTSFFDEHFYFAADGLLQDNNTPGKKGLRARAILAVESAFSAGIADGFQVAFGRLRVRIDELPWNGDYRVITPYSDVNYQNLPAGERLFETADIGIGTWEGPLESYIGPFLLPSATPGGAEVPPIPDLTPGIDPFHDAIGTKTPYPGTGKKYIADPARLGPVTGSPMAPFTAYNVGGGSTTKNHNIFRIEVRPPNSSLDVPPFYVRETTDFSLMGRLASGALPGKVTVDRANYKANGEGQVIALDVFANATPTRLMRLPGQPRVDPIMPVLSYVEAPCTGAIAANGSINPPPYTAVAGVEHPMVSTTTDYWGQSQPSALPQYVCVKDATSRNAAGQTAPSYYLKQVTDAVTVTQASFDSSLGRLKINAVSSDPTASLTLAGFGPEPLGKSAGTGLALEANSATVTGLQTPPSKAQVISSKGGSDRMKVDTVGDIAQGADQPQAKNDGGVMFEDCSATPATVCAEGQSFTRDLLGNDTILIGGTVRNLRYVINNNLATVSVNALAPGLGHASIINGILTYTPNPNVFGKDSFPYTVTVDGKTSNQAIFTIDITKVNDAPTAADGTTAGVINKPVISSLIANGNDPDGIADVKDAVITSWPAQLGPQPTPDKGNITFTPNAIGTYSFGFKVKDAAGLLSNPATMKVAVQDAETITVAAARYTAAQNAGGTATGRWAVNGTDSALMGQRLTIIYADGTLIGQNPCTGFRAGIPGCIVGEVVVDPSGAYAFDLRGITSGALNPTDLSAWAVPPTSIRVFSTLPLLGGSAKVTFELR